MYLGHSVIQDGFARVQISMSRHEQAVAELRFGCREK
jgi:hypothetical protein